MTVQNGQGTAPATEPATRSGWLESLAVYGDRRAIAMGLLGFAAGLPFLLVFSTLSAWLREAGIDRTTIGFLSWVGTFYAIKFLWAPVVDRAPLPLLSRLLGRRRSWMLLAQLAIIVGLVGMALSDPADGVTAIALFALLVAFGSATQDIVIDAYRIEIAPKEMQGAMSGAYIFGYRVALLAAGAGALYIAEYVSWTAAYAVMAIGMLVGVAAVLWAGEPKQAVDRSSILRERRVVEFLERHAGLPDALRGVVGWIYGAVVAPFVEFFARNGWMALAILAFIGLYKLSDVVMGVMANPFYIDLGFSKEEIAQVSKLYGFIMGVGGALAGGVIVARFGVLRPLVLGVLLVAVPNLLFAAMAGAGKDMTLFILTISADNLGQGVAGAVLVAYLSSLTNAAYTATQYALFSSFMALPGRFLGGFSGMMVDDAGYLVFFIVTAAMGVPALLLALYLIVRDRALRAVPTPAAAPAAGG